MYIPVEIEEGSLIKAVSDVYKDQFRYNRDLIKGMVKSINTQNQTVKVFGYNKCIPFYRIFTFTFGGVEVPNKYYDEEKIVNTDAKKIKKI